MRILLIQPSEFSGKRISPAYEKYGKFKARKNPFLMRPICLPPLGLLYVASAIKHARHEVEILDAYTLQLSTAETVNEAVFRKPHIIGISLYTLFLREVYLLTKELKKVLKIPIILGGPHVSAMPGKTMEEFTDIDYLMTGWADFSIVDFLDLFSGTINVQTVPGLWYRAGHSVKKNREAAFPENLDDIPIPERSIIKDMYDSKMYNNITIPNRKIDVLLTSRNCPFSCKFCQNLTGHKYLPHSPERVIQELDYIASMGTISVEIMDDIFTVDRARVNRIFELIALKNYNLDFRIRSRVTLVDREFLEKFKRIGGRAVSYGMESGSDTVLKLMNKGTNVDANERACLMTKEAGLICQSTWLFGWPGETREALEETFKCIGKILPHTINFCSLIPLPGTTVYDEAKANGALTHDWSVHNTKEPYIRTAAWPELGPLIQVLCYKSFFVQIHPRYLWQTLQLIIRLRNYRLVLYGFKLIFITIAAFLKEFP
jgi:anaerobic magnesium-protoporphyrin IX monomethyl ester cyclase